MKKMFFVLAMIFVMSLSMLSVYAATTSTIAATDSSSIQVSLLSQYPDPAIAGNVVELRLGISNDGGRDVNNLVVEFIPSFPFESVQGSDATQIISVVQGYQGQNDDLKTLTYKVLINKDVSPGTYDFKVQYYSQGSGTVISETLSVDIRSQENAEIIHIDKTVIIPGAQTPLKFVINNVGNAPLRDLTFSWNDDDNILLPVGSDNTRYIKYIGLNSSAEVEYQVIADTNAQAGLYKLNLYLTYHNSINNSDTRISTIAGIYVGGETDFDIAFSESSSGQTSFTIANIGSNPASSVSVIIPRQSSWTTTGSNSMIVGNLNKGDYTVASFTLSQTALAQNRTRGNFTNLPADNPRENMTMPISTPNIIDIQIAYTDTTGVRRIVDKQVQMNSQSSGNSTLVAGARSGQFTRPTQQSTFSKYMWYIILLVVLVAAFIIYRKHKKNKLMNPKSKFADVFKKKR